MKKGKFGIVLSFYAIIGFVLTILGQSLLGALLLVFVLAVEKDEWATRQTMQAFFLTLFSGAVSTALNALQIFVITYNANSVYSTAEGYINKIVDIAVIVFAIIGIVRNVSGKDAGIPVFSYLSKKVYGYVTAPTPQQNAGSNNYQQNQYSNVNK